MFINPYETSIMKRQNNDKVLTALSFAQVEGTLIENALPNYPFIQIVAGKDAATDTIGPINHPLVTKDGHIIIDLRPYNNQIFDSQGQVVLPKAGPSALLVKQAILQHGWNDPTVRKQLSIVGDDFALKVFANWVSNAITKRLGLTADISLQVTGLVAWYYRCLFMTEQDMDLSEEALLNQAGKIAKVSWLSAEQAFELIADVGYIEDLAGLVSALKGLNAKRLDALSNSLLITMLVGSWYGSTGARESVAIALEYPPTFIGMLNAAVSEKMYRKTPIAETAERFKRNNAIKTFLSATSVIIKNLEE